MYLPRPSCPPGRTSAHQSLRGWRGRADVIGLSGPGRALHVADLDALDGTPVLDIKPYLREFAPQDEVRQAPWATNLMHQYY
ncbi:TrmO family methyltransferase domain-containing protein [Nonomuraea sp. 10N515B]|uniref:TrmO family methyltransferase domain-containing protein n=1 Tax=Nonomuraea sp. 10N515B TaxID=3457422 RepID=UPI003FCC9507